MSSINYINSNQYRSRVPFTVPSVDPINDKALSSALNKVINTVFDPRRRVANSITYGSGCNVQPLSIGMMKTDNTSSSLLQQSSSIGTVNMSPSTVGCSTTTTTTTTNSFIPTQVQTAEYVSSLNGLSSYVPTALSENASVIASPVNSSNTGSNINNISTTSPHTNIKPVVSDATRATLADLKFITDKAEKRKVHCDTWFLQLNGDVRSLKSYLRDSIEPKIANKDEELIALKTQVAIMKSEMNELKRLRMESETEMYKQEVAHLERQRVMSQAISTIVDTFDRKFTSMDSRLSTQTTYLHETENGIVLNRINSVNTRVDENKKDIDVCKQRIRDAQDDSRSNSMQIESIKADTEKNYRDIASIDKRLEKIREMQRTQDSGVSTRSDKRSRDRREDERDEKSSLKRSRFSGVSLLVNSHRR